MGRSPKNPSYNLFAAEIGSHFPLQDKTMIESPTTARLDYLKREIFLHINSNIELKTRTRSCAKEPDLVDWIESNFKAGEVFFDVGANVGAYSLVATKFLDGDLRTYSF